MNIVGVGAAFCMGCCPNIRNGAAICPCCMGVAAYVQTIFRSVTIAKLLYASSAWSGFTEATDRQRVNGFLRRSIRCGYCLPDFPTFADQCATADEKLI